MLLILPFISLVDLGLAAVVTVYATNYHTVLNVQTHTTTQLTTQWTTQVHSYEEPTTTITSTVLTTTTLSSSTPFASSILQTHNEKRALHQGTSALAWSDTIASIAQAYADQYNCNGTLIHSHNGYGENLALGYNSTGAVEAWYDEVSLYNYDDPVFSESTGHFTQLVWRNTTVVGCGYLDCGDYYGQYTVCQYYAPGNYAGEFEENVMPLIE